MKRLALLLLFAVTAFGQDAATVALETVDLAAAFQSSDALTRATAARVALVRDRKELVPQLREVLKAEEDATVAREVVRALVLLGSDDDVAFAVSQLRRFPLSLDSDFGEMVARIGAPRATSLYLKYARELRDPAPNVRLALWGRTSLASGTASRLMATGNDLAYGSLLDEMAKASFVLDPGVLTAALNSANPQIVNDTVWHLVELYAFDPSKLPAALRELATAKREKASAAEELGRELLRRMLGAKAVERPEFFELLKGAYGRELVPERPDVRRHLTLAEQDALEGKPARHVALDSPLAQAVLVPEFRLPILLPAGLAEAILRKTKCTDSWIGVAKATVDRAGRVRSVDLSNVGVAGGCKAALEAMLQLSLADPEKITSPLESANLLVVKPRARAVCMDEHAPENVLQRRGLFQVGRDLEPPRVKKRIEPVFPADVRREMKAGSVPIIVESVITRTGCVRDIRLVTQSRWPTLNTSAVLAVSEWQFEPARIDGTPVDVIFNLTVNYKLR